MDCVRAVHFALCLVGVLLSSYAYHVERRAERDDFDGAMCDIRPGISCTTALTSNFSKGMGIVGSLLGEASPLNFSNSLYGIMLYCLLIILAFIPALKWLLLTIQTVAVIFEVYLTYLMFFVLKDVCVICTSIAIINGTLWPVTFALWRESAKKSRTSKKAQ